MPETLAMNIYESTFAQSDRTDAILVVEGKKLHVNKAFLSSHSDYFDTLFNGNFMEKSMKEIEIKDVKYEDFAALLNLIYPKPIMPTEENAEKLRELADRFLLLTAKCDLDSFIFSTDAAKSPFDFRVLIFYDAYQQKTVENSYKNYEKLCGMFEKEAIPHKDYKYWFKLYTDSARRGLYSNARHFSLNHFFQREISGIPDIRGCILSDVINRKSAGKSYVALCKAFGAHKIDKESHECWYKKFKNGQLFTRVTFFNLPEDIIADIVEKCDDLKSLLNLRNVSHGFRTLVDRKKPEIRNIRILCRDEYNEVKLNNLRSEMAFNYLKVALRNPKLELDTLFIELCNENPMKYDEILLNIFKSMDHKIPVQHLSIKTKKNGDLTTVLKCLKPGVLKKLTMSGLGKKWNIDRLVEMEQWKQAEHVEIHEMITFSIDKFAHLSRFDVLVQELPIENFVELVNTVSRSADFKSCRIRVWDEFDKEIFKEVMNLQLTATRRVYSIPNSNLFIEFSPSSFIIRRVNV